MPDEFENLASPQTTAIPEATDRPMMGETPKPDGMPEATAAPEPTDTPEPAPTAEPTSTPEPEPTIEPDGTHVEVDLNGGESYSTSSIIVIDDVAMEYYGFAQQSASRYVAALNDIAAAFDETVNVYNMIVPTAIEFYLPEKYGGNTGYQRKAINYYYSGLSERIRTIDVYDDLKSHMAEYIYFRTDHHWTQRGAYYAYRVFMEAIGETPHELSEYRTKSVPGYLGSLYKYLGGYAALEKNPDVVEIFYPITAYTAEKYDSYGGGRSEAWLVYEEISHSHTYSYFMGGDNPLTVAVTEAGNDRKLLVIKESYGNAITPLFADHFSEVHAIDPRSYYARTIPQYVTENGITDVLFINYTVGAGAVNVIDGLERLK